MSNTGNIDSCLGLTKSQGHGPKKKKKNLLLLLCWTIIILYDICILTFSLKKPNRTASEVYLRKTQLLDQCKAENNRSWEPK